MTAPTQTLYKLFLGDQQTSAPYHFKEGYTIHSAGIYVYPTGGSFSFGSLGYHTTNSGVSFTKYNTQEGDVIYTNLEKHFLIKAIKAWPNSDGSLAFYEVGIEEMPNFPFIAGFFGFEDWDHGTTATIGAGMFEDGFERGYWAL